MMPKGKADQRSEIGHSCEKSLKGAILNAKELKREWGRNEAPPLLIWAISAFQEIAPTKNSVGRPLAK
jgi:hypothetical protein